MRIRLPLRRTLFFVSMFLFAVVALLPLRLAVGWLGLDRGGFAAREANGSLWLGTFQEARFGSMPLGDLQVQLRTMPLFAGMARIDLTRMDEEVRAGGSITVSRHRLGLDDLEGQLDTGGLFAPLPITRIGLDDVTAHFANGLCETAEGRVSATLFGEIAGISLPGGLSGNARCDNGAVLLPLASTSGMETVNVRLFADGRYVLEVEVRPGSTSLPTGAVQPGFTANQSGAQTLRIEDRF